MTNEVSTSTPPLDARFTTTHWSVVLAAGDSAAPQAAEALEKLCRTYWPPLYGYVRRRGYQLHDAQDLTQGFFAQLLEKNYVQSADRARGKFRTFLLSSMQHFLANYWRDAHTQKRGGQAAFISFEEADAAGQDVTPASPGLSAEQLFEKQWAMTILEQALGKLESEFTAAGKTQWFQELKVFLTGDKHEATYADLAVKLGSAEGALRTTVNRLRRQYADLVRAEVAETVANPGEVEAELRALFAALSA